MTDIADGEILYRYADPSVFPAGQSELPVSIFTDAEMSCDWAQLQAAPEFSPHVKSGRRMIVSIKVCDAIRNPTNPKREGQVVGEWKQSVVHDPLAEKAGDPFTPNQSHALIKGRKKGGVTTAIRANSTYRIIET